MKIVRWHDDHNPTTTWFIIDLDYPENQYEWIRFYVDGVRQVVPRSFSEGTHTVPMYKILEEDAFHTVTAITCWNGHEVEVSESFSIPAGRPENLPNVMSIGANIDTPSDYTEGTHLELRDEVTAELSI